MTLKPTIHLCLINDIVTVNITPVLDPHFRPQEVILVHSRAKSYQADCVEAVLKPTGVTVSRWVIQDTQAIEPIRDRILELLIARETEDIALNVSGGTRLISLAAYEIFTEFNKPIFYVHPQTDDVIWMHQRDLPVVNVADRIKLPAFLRAHGAEVSHQRQASGIPIHLRRLTQELISHTDTLSKPLATLNWLAQQAETSLQSPYLTEAQRTWRELNALIQGFATAGLLTYQDSYLRFPDESARFFVNGGWLEDYTYSLIFGLRTTIPKIQDIGHSIEIVRDGTGKAVKNELDVAFLYNNHLYIIECKTKRFLTPSEIRSADFDTPGADVLYKLDTLKGILGGVHTHVMLVSYHSLSAWDKQRAQDLQIETCTGQQLVNLTEALTRWLSQAIVNY
jgi:hypothetical protein